MTTQKEGEEQGKLQAGGGSHCRIQKHLEAVLDQSFPVIVHRSCSVGGWAQHSRAYLHLGAFLWLSCGCRYNQSHVGSFPLGYWTVFTQEGFSQDGPATQLLIFLLHIPTSLPFSEPNRDCAGSWA